MLEQALADLTAQVTELNRLMAKLVADTADAVEPKKARKPRQAASDPTPENPTPAAPSNDASEAAAAAPEAAAAAPAPDYASLRANVRGAAMRLAAHIGRDPAIARVSERLKSLGLEARNIGAVPDEHLQGLLAWLEAEITTALREAA